MRLEWKATSLREFRQRTRIDLTDALIRKFATFRCSDHPDVPMRLSEDGGRLWIDACCRRGHRTAVGQAEFEVEAPTRWYTPN
jgi:hypothetical protein